MIPPETAARTDGERLAFYFMQVENWGRTVNGTASEWGWYTREYRGIPMFMPGEWNSRFPYATPEEALDAAMDAEARAGEGET